MYYSCMDERLLSKPLDVHHLSEHEEVKKVINQILAEMKDSGALGRSSVVKIRKHLKVVVLDLYLTYSSESPSLCCLLPPRR